MADEDDDVNDHSDEPEELDCDEGWHAKKRRKTKDGWRTGNDDSSESSSGDDNDDGAEDTSGKRCSRTRPPQAAPSAKGVAKKSAMAMWTKSTLWGNGSADVFDVLEQEEKEDGGEKREGDATAETLGRTNASSDEARKQIVAEMMKRLSTEEQNGMFRALPQPFDIWAASEHIKKGGGRIPIENVSFSTIFGSVTAASARDPSRGNSGTGPAITNIHIRDEDGPVLARGYERTIADEHGFYVQFGMRHLNREVTLQRQPRTKWSDEYGWTPYKVAGIEVYYAGSDPFLQQQKDTEGTIIAPQPVPQTASVVLPTTIVPYRVVPKCESGMTFKQARLQGQKKVTDFFCQQTPATKTTPAARDVKVTEKKKAQTMTSSAPKRKHSQFSRNVFYARVIDVLGVAADQEKEKDNEKDAPQETKTQ